MVISSLISTDCNTKQSRHSRQPEIVVKVHELLGRSRDGIVVLGHGHAAQQVHERVLSAEKICIIINLTCNKFVWIKLRTY